MAASMIAMRSRFSAPDILAGRIMVLTATTLPRHMPAGEQKLGPVNVTTILSTDQVSRAPACVILQLMQQDLAPAAPSLYSPRMYSKGLEVPCMHQLESEGFPQTWPHVGT